MSSCTSQSFPSPRICVTLPLSFSLCTVLRGRTPIIKRKREREELNKQGLDSLNISSDKFSKGWEMHILIHFVSASSSTLKFSKYTHVYIFICSSYDNFYEIGGIDFNISENRHWCTKSPVWIHPLSHTRAKQPRARSPDSSTDVSSRLPGSLPSTTWLSLSRHSLPVLWLMRINTGLRIHVWNLTS